MANDDATTLHRPRFRISDAGLAYALRVTAGPDAGRTLICEPSGNLPAHVGQSDTGQLVLTDREVSRRHLRLNIEDGLLVVEDLRSKNGTFVNGVGVRLATLRGGETIRIGATEITVEAKTATPAPPVLETSFGRLLGLSHEMRRLFPLLRKLADSDVPIGVEGEAGTGKELLAEVLHESGPRAEKPFIVFDCSAVAPHDRESELFGIDATSSAPPRKGALELANGGTLFIDEIGDLDLALQPKLLRAIERRQIRRVGGDRPIDLDVRVIASTRRDLDREVQSGRFREDLLRPLTVARIVLPPLRERRGDVPLLVERFARELGREPSEIPAEQFARWSDAPWFGNVRELRNAVMLYLALGEVAPLARGKEADLPGGYGVDPAGEAFMQSILSLRLPLPEARRRVVEEFEQRYVEDVLRAHDGHVGKAAAASGIARRHFQRVRGKGAKGHDIKE